MFLQCKDWCIDRLGKSQIFLVYVTSIEINNVVYHLQSKMWFYFLGEVIFLATMIVKNWRIYCIFNNKSLKIIVSQIIHACRWIVYIQWNLSIQDLRNKGTSLSRTLAVVPAT